MSGELEIPERAWRVFGSSLTYGEILGVKAAARIIVAEAFRRFAEVARCSHDQSLARKIADELDPPAVNT